MLSTRGSALADGRHGICSRLRLDRRGREVWNTSSSSSSFVQELATLRHERKTKSQIAARRIAVVFRYCTCIDFCILQANGTRLWHDPCDLRILQFLEICSLWVLTLEVKGGRCFFSQLWTGTGVIPRMSAETEQ